MSASILDEVRTSCAAVAARSRLVRIDHDRLDAYAGELGVSTPVADDDPGRMRLATEEDTVAFVLALDAINFGSGWFPVLRKRPGMSGYHTIASIFRERCTSVGAPSAAWLATVTAEDCTQLFEQDADGEAFELMGHFADALNELGAHLRDHHDGSAAALVASASHSAATLVERLRRLPHFEDRRSHRGAAVAFYKRAQIVAADLHLALDGRGAGRFDDLDRLTIFADNLVPHVLRVDGVLVLDDGLAARIDGEELLVEGSEEEVELRACAVHAAELLAARMGTTAAALDNVLWNRGQGPAYKAIPRPRCRTVSY